MELRRGQNMMNRTTTVIIIALLLAACGGAHRGSQAPTHSLVGEAAEIFVGSDTHHLPKKREK